MTTTETLGHILKDSQVKERDPSTLGTGEYFQLGDFKADEQKYGDRGVGFVKLGDGMATKSGFFQNGRLILETSICGVNPHLWNTAYCNPDLIAHLTSHYCPFYDQISTLFVQKGIVVINDWDHNYQHFLVETFPRIFAVHEIAKKYDLPIVVFDTSWIRNLVNIVFNDVRFIFIKSGQALRLAEAYFVEAAANNFGTIIDLQIAAYRYMREKVFSQIQNNVPSPRGKGFMYRLPLEQNAGNQRHIQNYWEIQPALAKNGYEVFYLDNADMAFKASILRRYNFIITPIGANVMNFLLSPLDVSFTILEHPNFSGGKWFIELFQRLGFTGVMQTTRITRLDETHATSHDSNIPYKIELTEFHNLIHSIAI